MPRLMTKDDVMQTAVNLGRAGQVWFEFCDSSSCPPGITLPDGGAYQLIFLRVSDATPQVPQKSGIKIGLMKGKWKAPSEDDDKMMDAEIASAFDMDGGL